MSQPRDAYEPPRTLDPEDEGPALDRPSKGGDLVLAILLVSSFGAPFVLGAGILVGAVSRMLRDELGLIFGACGGIGVMVLLTIFVYREIRSRGRSRARKAVDILVLFVLPAWGLLYSHFLGMPECEVSSCSADESVFRPFAEPEIYGLIALHALTVLAYFISRRRPAALRPFAEALVHATLLAGAITHAIVAVHVGRWLPIGLVLAPVFIPCAAPLLTVILYSLELRDRLRRRGREAATRAPYQVPDSPFRQGPLQTPLAATERIHSGFLLRAMALAPGLLGLHAVVHALWLGRADGALRVFTRTCGHVLSQVPITVLPDDCHYLCTVAARGHTWLVRPERMGRRGGVPIVVNRQLALANAFEDLLHERWPRFGRLARRIYDRLGLPVSRYIKRRWLADLTYLAMKPAEWLFAIALLLLDRGDPERRIERMYR